MEHDRDPRPKRDARTYVIAILIVVLVSALVVLHLTGIVGPASH